MPRANGSHESVVPFAHRSYASPIASTTAASATSHGPPTMASTSPATALPIATTRAPRTVTSPAGIGLPGLWPASRGASTRSLTVPMANWSRVIDRPRTIGHRWRPARDHRDERDDDAVEDRRERVDQPGGGGEVANAEAGRRRPRDQT